MKLDPPLLEAVLVRRYKRFLADFTWLGEAVVHTASVPNTGSMMGLSTPGSRVFLSTSADPKRKYSHRLEIVEADGTLVGINTGLPNRLAEEAIDAGLVSNLADYSSRKREQRYGVNSRIDILLDDPTRGLAFVEVKNVHLMRRAGLAEFPDSKTDRGVKHLHELAEAVANGHRGIMLFVIQRGDCDAMALCRDIDAAYGEAFDAAIARGVEAYAIGCNVSNAMIEPTRLLPIHDVKS